MYNRENQQSQKSIVWKNKTKKTNEQPAKLIKELKHT